MRQQSLCGAFAVIALSMPIGRVVAQEAQPAHTSPIAHATKGDSTDKAEPAPLLMSLSALVIQHRRPLDQRGINQFESPKHDTVTYRGSRIAWGAAFS